MTAALEGGEWSAARPERTLPPGKTQYPFYRRLCWPQGRSGRAEKSRPHRDSIADRPARSSVAIPTELHGPQLVHLVGFIIRIYHHALSSERQNWAHKFISVFYVQFLLESLKAIITV